MDQPAFPLFSKVLDAKGRSALLCFCSFPSYRLNGLRSTLRRNLCLNAAEDEVPPASLPGPLLGKVGSEIT